MPSIARKGRAAAYDPPNRFSSTHRLAVDDGWGSLDALAEETASPRTEILEDRARGAISTNRSPDLDFDRSLNPYQGCEHGCIYCYARPSHARHGLSAGLDFESKIFARRGIAERLREELSRPSYRCAPIALGANTDPYQPIERRLSLTRRCLEVLKEARHPVRITTKSDLILRDLDLLAPMAAMGLAEARISIATLDPVLARKMDPRAPSPAKRLAALAKLGDVGIETGVICAPVIPALNDHELEAILEAAARAGARSAQWGFLRLPLEVKELMVSWLETHAPGRADRVISLLRQSRRGRLDVSAFGARMRGEGPYAQMIAQRFSTARKRSGLEERSSGLRTDRFRRPVEDRQMALL